jgi:hypothetical protein
MGTKRKHPSIDKDLEGSPRPRRTRHRSRRSSAGIARYFPAISRFQDWRCLWIRARRRHVRVPASVSKHVRLQDLRGMFADRQRRYATVHQSGPYAPTKQASVKAFDIIHTGIRLLCHPSLGCRVGRT